MKLLSIDQFCEMSGLHYDTVYNLIQQKLLPFDRIGASYRAEEQELIEWIKSGKAEIVKKKKKVAKRRKIC